MMPIHDWTRVSAGEFHAFHTGWLVSMQRSLNNGLLPDTIYALAEQHAGEMHADVLTLERPEPDGSIGDSEHGGTLVLDRPPQTSVKATIAREPMLEARRRSLAIRHVSGNRLVALVEVVSPANKDRSSAVERFIDKCVSAVQAGVHLVVIDLFPPRGEGTGGLGAAVWREIGGEPDLTDPATSLTQVAVRVGSEVLGIGCEVFAEHVQVGVPMPDLPLFYAAEWYVNLPLERTYNEAFDGVPRHLRRQLGFQTSD